VFLLSRYLREDAYTRGQHVYIANHQNNWDLFTVAAAVTPKVVTVGKKSLAFLPLFGQLYWLTGNILIDRGNRSKAMGTIDQVIDKMKNSDVSIWMFPEGTRNGHVIVEMLPPVSTQGCKKEQVREVANVCREQMEQKLAELNEEVKVLNQSK